MKTRIESLGSAGCVLLALLGAHWPAAGQSAVPAGSYGFLANANQMDTAGWTGGALVGVMNISESGEVTGTITFQGRDTVDPASQLGSSSFKGSYSAGSDGYGTLEMTFEDGFRLKLAVVATDGGRTLEFISPAAGAGNVTLRGSGGPGQPLTGKLPAALLLDWAAPAGSIDLSVRSSAGPGATVFTGRAEAATGTAMCPDGSSGEWTIGVENLTIAAIPAGNNGQALAGNYLLTAGTSACGDRGWTTLSGLATGSLTPTGMVLTLRNYGFIVTGTARAIKGGSLKGSYGLQSSASPFPGGSIGVMTFDGEGGVSSTVAGFVNGEFTTSKNTGTYSVEADGSGKINLNTVAGEPGGPSFSIVVVDDGAGFLFLRTRANPQGNVMFGHARLQ